MKVIIQLSLEDDLWGFSELIGDRKIEDCKEEIIDLINEDIPAALNNAIWKIEKD